MAAHSVWALLVAAVLVAITSHVEAQPDHPGPYRLPVIQEFLVLSPRIVRPLQTFEMHVTLFHMHYADITVRAMLSRNGEEYATAQETFYDKGTKPIQLMIPETVTDGVHKLVVQGLVAGGRGDPIFHNETTLEFQSKYISIFMQTNKPLYFPPNIVQFRIVGVTPDLRPVHGQAMILYIRDSRGNIVRRWLNQEMNFGMYQGSFELTYPVNTGTWHILVETHGHHYEQSFEVEFFYQRAFHVNVTVPLFIFDTEFGIAGTLNGEHTGSNKPSRGNATISLRVMNKDGTFLDGELNKTISYLSDVVPFDYTMQQMKEKWGDINGKLLFFKSWLYDWYFTETQNGTAVTQVIKEEISLRVLGRRFRTFKPGIPYTVYFAIHQADGSPYKGFYNRQVMVQTYHEGHGVPTTETEDKIVVPSDSIVRYEVRPRDEDYKIKITAKHLPAGSAVEIRCFKTYSRNNRYLSVTTQTEVPATDEYMTFTVRTNFFVDEVNYMINAGGNILLGNVLPMYSMQKTFSVALSRQMAPKARIVVYCVKAGEILTDVLNFMVRDTRLYNASIQLNLGKDFPEDTIELIGRSHPGSFIALNGHDYEFYRRGASTFLREDKIVRELLTYDKFEGPYQHTWYYEDDRWEGDVFFNAPTGGIDTITTFNMSGLIAMSDLNFTVIQEFTACNRSQGVGICLSGQCYDLDKECDGWEDCIDGYDEANCPLKEDELPKFRPPDTKYMGLMPRYFYEDSWMWVTSYVKHNGRVEVKLTVPEKPMPAVINAFVLHPDLGLSLSPAPVMHNTRRRFFMTAEAPPVTKRGEEIGIRLGLFNNWDQHMEVIVVLHGGDNYRFINVEDFGYVSSYSPRLSSGDVQIMVEMYAGFSTYIMMPVVPIVEVGEINVEIAAYSCIDMDKEIINIEIIYDGVGNDAYSPFLIDLNNKGSLLAPYFDIPIPQQFIVPGEREMLYIPGSNTATISIFGDVVSPGFFEDHLDCGNTAGVPHDSAEGYMYDYAINLQTLKYLKARNVLQSMSDAEAKATEYMRSILMRQYAYMQEDGSFKQFRRVEEPCVWITSFILKNLHDTLETDWSDDVYIPIDLLNKIARWLSSVQNETGAFHETSPYVYDVSFTPNTTDHQGVVHEWHIPVTAQVVITLATAIRLTGEAKTMAGTAKDNGAEYLANKLSEITDPFQMAITAYALQMAHHRDRDNAFQLLRMLNTSDEFVYWASEEIAPNPSFIYDGRVYLQDRGDYVNLENSVMATSYAMLLYLQYYRMDEALPIMKWLVNNRNGMLGWSSSKDTLLALQALTQYNLLAEYNQGFFDLEIKLSASSQPEWSQTARVDHLNFYEMQEFELTPAWGQLSATFEGTGYGVMGGTWAWNSEKHDQVDTADYPTYDFILDHLQFSGRNSSRMHMTACTRWLRPDLYPVAGMTNMIINVPTGFVVDRDAIESMYWAGTPGLKRVRFEESALVLFFEYMTTDLTCVSFTAERWYPIANVSIANWVSVRAYGETADNVYWANSIIEPNPFFINNGLFYMEKRMFYQNLENAVMATSYSLLLYIQYFRLEEAVPIMRWLVSQKYGPMKWSSSKDTLLALQALTQFSLLVEFNQDFFNIEVKLAATSNQDFHHTARVTHTTFHDLQQFKLGYAWGQVRAMFEGTGYAFIGIDYHWNTDKKQYVYGPDYKSYDFRIENLRFYGRNASNLEMTACARWMRTDLSPSAGMTNMLIDIPTGYVVDRDTIEHMYWSGYPGLKRIRFRDHTLVLFFEYISTTETCVKFTAERWYPVANMSIAHLVTIKDYAESGLQYNTQYDTYTLFHLHICQVCGSFQCPYCQYYNHAPPVSPLPAASLLLLSLLTAWVTRLGAAGVS